MIERLMDEFRTWFAGRILIFIWMVGSVVVTLAGPFGTFDSMQFVPRAIFWAGLIAVSLVLSLALAAVAQVVLADWPVLARDLLVVVVFSVLFTPIVMQAIFLATGGVGIGHLDGVTLGLTVMAITACVSLILHQLRQHATGAGGPSAIQVSPRLLDRLEGVTVTQLLRLTVDDHYVVVVLTCGTQHRILMRFGDAVDEMAGVEGWCIHRSHWVMRRAVVTVVKRKGREVAVLTNGDAVPVSRTYRQNLVTAGFLQADSQRAAVSSAPAAR